MSILLLRMATETMLTVAHQPGRRPNTAVWIMSQEQQQQTTAAMEEDEEVRYRKRPYYVRPRIEEEKDDSRTRAGLLLLVGVMPSTTVADLQMAFCDFTGAEITKVFVL